MWLTLHLVWLPLLQVKNSCLLSHSLAREGLRSNTLSPTMLHPFIMQLFRNSSSVNNWPDLAISSVTIKLAFTVASLWDFALMKDICWNVTFFFNSSTFCILCSAFRFFFLILMFCLEVSFYFIFLNYGHISSTKKTHGFTDNVSKHILSQLSALKGSVFRINFSLGHCEELALCSRQQHTLC